MELRVVNRSNRLLELVEYDSTTKTTTVIGVVEPSPVVAYFPGRGDAEITYALRWFDGTSKGWLTTDRTNEAGDSAFAVERRCR